MLTILEETYLLHEILKNARIKSLLDLIFPKSKPDIHRDMFKYEHSPTAMQLIIHKYRINWIKEHSKICERLIAKRNDLTDFDKMEIMKSFNCYLLQLISKLEPQYSNEDIVNFILNYKEKRIDNFLENAENVNNKQIEIEFKLEREIRLIDRELNNFKI